MRETATTDRIIADMRALADTIDRAIRDKPPDASRLNLLIAKNEMLRCVYQHEAEMRLCELMRVADSFGQAASSVTIDHR
jgi:hypothetical protein